MLFGDELAEEAGLGRFARIDAAAKAAARARIEGDGEVVAQAFYLCHHASLGAKLSQNESGCASFRALTWSGAVRFARNG